MKTLSQRILLEKNEQVHAVVRKHWFILLAKTFTPIVLMVLPFVLLPLMFQNEIITTLAEGVSWSINVEIFFSALWILFMWMMIFYGWTDYYLDMWTVTNRRVIAIDQRGLFRRSVASFRYERLQDINIEIHGLIPTFFDFGTLEVQTAGHGESEFIIHGVPHPREVKARILEAADARVQSNANAPFSTPSDDGV